MEKKWYVIGIILALCGILTGNFSCGPFPSAQPDTTPTPSPPWTEPPQATPPGGAWWYPEWQFRKELIISDPLPGYQMELKVYWDDIADNASEGIINCEGHCNVDFSDLRFVYPNNCDVCDYWIEKIVPNEYCRVWIETSGESTVYMYYGHSSAKDAGNGLNTFPKYFDHWIVDHTEQFQYQFWLGENNRHQWSYLVNQFTTERRFVTVGKLIDYYINTHDRTLIGFLEDPDILYNESDNYISLYWDHVADNTGPVNQVWVQIKIKNNGTTYDTDLKSLGNIPDPEHILKIEIIYTSQEVSYVITNLSTQSTLAQDSITDPAQIPDMAITKYFFIAARDFYRGIFEYRFPSTISWGNQIGNGGMRFDSDYWFITGYTDSTKPLWNVFNNEESAP